MQEAQGRLWLPVGHILPARELETTSPIFSQAVKLQLSSLSACRHSFTMYKICTNGMADSVSSTGSWCAQAPCVTKYHHSLIRKHLCECLTKSSLSEFPAKGERSLRPIQYQSVMRLDIFCICRLPEHQDEEWAECEKCLKWFHRHCLDIPDNVFNEVQEPWMCPNCEKTCI